MHTPARGLYPEDWTGWQQWQPGERVMVRYQTHSTPPLTDALGVIMTISSDSIVIETRRGQVTVPTSLIVTGKPVPPPPTRRSRSRPDHTQ